MITPDSIPASPTLPPAMDYDLLRSRALARIQDLCGALWTDYNEHDPGVTVLEILCYAITDLGYRVSFPMADLLTTEEGRLETGAQALFVPPQIFPTHPATPDDYRKLLIDHFPGVINAWLTPRPDPAGVLGLYQVEVLSGAGSSAPLAADVSAFLNSVRNLGERFAGVTVLSPTEITIDVTLQIDPVANPTQLLSSIGTAVQNSLMPPIPFQSLQDACRAGMPADEVFSGPLLTHGFLRSGDLWPKLPASGVKDAVVYALSQVPGVRATGECQVHVPKSALDGGFTLCIRNAADPGANPANHIRFLANQKDVTVTTDNLLPPATMSHGKGTANLDPVQSWKTALLPAGTWRDTASYPSIQEQFPACYGLEKNGLSARAPALRRAQASQLRAYLAVFEQLMADFLSQLSELGRLFSVREETHTYFGQPLYEVPGFASIVGGFDYDHLQESPEALARAWKAFQENPANPYWSGVLNLLETPETFARRRARFLDHLLARFGEIPKHASWHTFETRENNRRYLAHYPELSCSRANGLNLEEKEGQTVSTLEKKINILLAAGPREPGRPYRPPPADPSLKSAVPYAGQAYYMVEHILLWPPPAQGSTNGTPANGQTNASVDAAFFSLRLSHVLTNWTFFPEEQDSVWQEFQKYVQTTISDQAPAHLRNDFYWIGADEMDEFGKLYKAWAKAGFPPLQPASPETPPIRVQNKGPAYALFYWIKRREKTAVPSSP